MLKQKTMIIVLVLMILSSTVYMCFANSAEPPSVLVIVPDAPENLEINIDWGNSSHRLKEIEKTDKIIETYFEIYLGNLKQDGDYTLNIKNGEENFAVKLNKPLKGYQNIYTLDLNNKTLIEGKMLSRSVLLVTMRVVLTLAIEAAVFLIFGFKNKRSWAAFLIINLITQGTLNIWLNGFAPSQSYLILNLIFSEFFVFVFEIAAFLKFVKEHKKLRIVLYVLIANLLSLIAGGYIITILPI